MRKVPGVIGARVTLVPPRAEVETLAGMPAGTLAAAVRAAGDYSIREIDGEVPVASASTTQEPP